MGAIWSVRESPWGLSENYRFLGSPSAEMGEADLEWVPGSSLLGKILRGLWSIWDYLVYNCSNLPKLQGKLDSSWGLGYTRVC